MSPRGMIGAQLDIRHVSGLYFVVFRRKVKVGAAWHQDGFCLDIVECPLKVTSVGWISADVGTLPGPELYEQIVRIPVQVIFLPTAEQGFHRIKPQSLK